MLNTLIKLIISNIYIAFFYIYILRVIFLLSIFIEHKFKNVSVQMFVRTRNNTNKIIPLSAFCYGKSRVFSRVTAALAWI